MNTNEFKQFHEPITNRAGFMLSGEFTKPELSTALSATEQVLQLVRQ